MSMAGTGAIHSGEVAGRQGWLHVYVISSVTLEPSSRRDHAWFNALLSPFWNSDINTSLLTFIPLFSPLRYHIGARILRLQAAGTNFSLLKIAVMGTSLWCSRQESICQCMECGFDPWSRKIPRAMEQLNPCTRTTEAGALEPTTRNH